MAIPRNTELHSNNTQGRSLKRFREHKQISSPTAAQTLVSPTAPEGLPTA